MRNSGGLVIDHGWLRVLGTGTDLLPDVVSESDRGRAQSSSPTTCWAAGHFNWCVTQAGAKPTVHYFAPDTLEYEDLDLGYGEWLQAMLSGAMT